MMFLNTAVGSKKTVAILIYSLLAVSVTAIVYLVLLGVYVTPYQDDFYQLLPNSLAELEETLERRYGWTGRYTATTLFIIFGWLKLYTFVPFVGFAILFLGLFCVSGEVLRLLKLKQMRKTLSALIASWLVLIVFFVTPSVESTFYWMSAAPIHLWSYGLVLLIVAFMMRLFTVQEVRLWRIITLCLVAAITALMGEVAALYLLLVFAIFGVVSYFKLNKVILKTSVLGFILMIISLLILMYSPGALNRAAQDGGYDVSPLSVLSSELPGTVVTFLSEILQSYGLLLATVFFGVLIAILLAHFGVKKINLTFKKMVILIFALGLTAVCAVLANISVVLVSVPWSVDWLPYRTQVVSSIVIIIALFASGFVFGVYLNDIKSLSRYRTVFIVLLILLSVLAAAAQSFYVSDIKSLRAELIQRQEVYLIRQYIIEDNMLNDTSCPYILPSYSPGRIQEGADLTVKQDHWLNVGWQMYFRSPCPIISDN